MLLVMVSSMCCGFFGFQSELSSYFHSIIIGVFWLIVWIAATAGQDLNCVFQLYLVSAINLFFL
ncbi:hypothetical protein RchiOBHm_Chr1g0350391 [Rosa chinensis]|uniref:Uncharacterized protein n=1 Tax=Rosa chinensis TaxID=74649 RepID=A0A2P6SG20_ROSCH|nr:hypothetical protein RchiOBHm_Chr1g0350391 [Rosa chinensis]